MSCNVMSCHVMPCHVMSCHVMSCHAMPCHVMSCHVMSLSCHVHDGNALLVERDRVDRVDVRLLVVRHLLAVALEHSNVPKHQRRTTRTRSHPNKRPHKSNVKRENVARRAWRFPPDVAPFPRSVASVPPDRRGAQPTDPTPTQPNPNPTPTRTRPQPQTQPQTNENTV